MTPILGVIASQITGHLSTNSFESIQTVTVGSTAQSSISFTSIPSTYKHLQIRGIYAINYGTNDTGYTNLQFNGDTSSNYTRHQILGDGASANAYGAASQTKIAFNTTLFSSSTSTFASCIIDILDYTSTAKYKTVRALSGVDKNGSGVIGLSSGVWMNTTNPISSIVISYDGTLNFPQFSSFALYGVKG